MNVHKTVLAVVALMLSAATLQAQQGEQGPFTLEQCIATGLKHNIEVHRARNAVERSRTFRRQAVGDFLPSVAARGSWTRYDRDQIGFRGNELFTSRNSYSYNVQAGLTVFDGLRNFNTVDQSLYDYEASEQGLLRTREDIVFMIQQGYFNVLRFEQLVKVAESNLERSSGQLERIREMNAVGSVPQADVYRQEVTVGNDELAVIEARNNAQNAKVDLQALLGIAPTMEFALQRDGVPLEITDTDVQSYRASLSTFEDMVDGAMQTRADMRQSALNVKSAEKGVSIASSGHYPSVTAFAQYTWNNLELAAFDMYDRFFYGVSVSLPLFSNFQVSANVERSEIVLREAELMQNQLRRSIATDIMRALNDLEMAEKNLDISGKKLQSAREDQRIAQERYNLGAGTLLDMIVANANFTLAESDVVNATFNYLVARRQMDYQLGRIQY
ncbi:MAG: TolC family protein [Bacteroidota bacterium]|nr:TolC family protein [Bacteroidota bacterium]